MRKNCRCRAASPSVGLCIGSKHPGAYWPWTTTRYMALGKYGLLAQKRGLKDADNEWVNNLTPTCAHPQRFDGPLSHCSALRKSFKTASFRPSAASSISPVRPYNRLPPLEPKFQFGSPQKSGFGFGFKTDPGHTKLVGIFCGHPLRDGWEIHCLEI